MLAAGKLMKLYGDAAGDIQAEMLLADDVDHFSLIIARRAVSHQGTLDRKLPLPADHLHSALEELLRLADTCISPGRCGIAIPQFA